MADSLKRNPDSNFKEAVSINTGRVYDSCCDRDCLQDLTCLFSAEGQSIIDNAVSVRMKSATVLNVYADVEQINFNKGFYSSDLTFFFLVTLDAFMPDVIMPTEVKGICVFSKKVILFGSEGNVKVFSNPVSLESSLSLPLREINNSPRCIVQAVDPICLTAKLTAYDDSYTPVRNFPDYIAEILGGEVVIPTEGMQTVLATLGLFTIIQLVRDVQMLVPVYDFYIPEKQCNDTADEPCDVFRQIAFPKDDFFPPKATDGCGCNT